MAALKHAFKFENNLDLPARYNIAPTDPAEVVLEENGRRLIVTMTFGLIPHWAKDPKMGLHCLNARAETISEKPAFRESFKKRRCLVLADGFYEWDRSGKIKIPYLVRQKNEEPFAMAGFWETWKRPDGREMKTFSIITTAPNPLVKTIDDRMPVILRKELYAP